MLSDRFICRTEEFTTFDRHIPAPYFRKTFFLESVPQEAHVTVCGLGFYELYVNGISLTKGILAPYISNPDDRLYYDRYDLSPLLQKGKNVVALLLGNGFLNDPAGEIWDFDKAAFRASPKLALALEADGALLLEADESFRTADSPILFDDYRSGEHYDARKEIPGWTEIGYDDRTWDCALPALTPRGEKRLCTAEPVRAVRSLRPSFVRPCGDGYLYGFSENMAGFCRLTLDGMRGQTIELTYGEVLADGKLDMENICFGEKTRRETMHKDIYIAKGERGETYEPHFTYHGFQYVRVRGITPEQATLDLLTAQICHSDLQQAGSFSCSDDTLNRLLANARRSALANFYYFPTDCPHREKNGWTGDIALSAEQFMFYFAAENSLAEWLNNLRAAQREDGALPGIVPTTGWGFVWGNGPAWDNALVQATYYAYKYSGKREILLENAGAIQKYLHYLSSRRNEEGLVAFGLGDWCQVNREPGDPTTALEITDTLTAVDLCRKAARIAAVLQDDALLGLACSLAQSFSKAFRKKYVCKEGILTQFATQTALAMAIDADVLHAEEKNAALDALLFRIEKAGGTFDTGVLGNRHLYRVLAENGHAPLAYRLIVTPKFPSFAYQIAHGATTLWESFIRVGENDAKPNDSMTSRNHHFWGDVAAWMARDLAGIDINPLLEDADAVCIRPCLIDKLTFEAERTYRGRTISVQLRETERGRILLIRVPAEMKLRLGELPQDCAVTVERT